MYDLLREVANLSAPTRGIPEMEEVEFVDCECDDENLTFAWIHDIDFPEMSIKENKFDSLSSIAESDDKIFDYISNIIDNVIDIDIDDDFFHNVELHEVLDWRKDPNNSNKLIITIDVTGLENQLIKFHD